MTVLITGAAGFLGRHFMRRYYESGEEIVAIDNMQNPNSYWPDPVEENWQGGGTILKMNEDAGEVLEHFGGDSKRFDVALHFAAPVGGREKIEGDPLFNAGSLGLDTTFFRWATKAKPNVCVYPSSSAVYPVVLQGGTPVALSEYMFSAENPEWGAPDEMYGFTKLAGERLAAAAAKYGVNTLCIRPFSGYGEGQSPEYPMTAIALRACRRENPLVVWGSGEQRRDFIHVDDITKAVVARLAAGVSGYQTLNLGSGHANSFNEIAKICAEVVGYDPVFSHDETKPVGVDARFCNPDRMKRYYEPQVRLREGVTRVVRWLQTAP